MAVVEVTRMQYCILRHLAKYRSPRTLALVALRMHFKAESLRVELKKLVALGLIREEAASTTRLLVKSPARVYSLSGAELREAIRVVAEAERNGSLTPKPQMRLKF